MSKKIAYMVSILAAVLTIATFYSLNGGFKDVKRTDSTSRATSDTKNGSATSTSKVSETEEEKLEKELPDVHSSDWDLVLVNPDTPIVNTDIKLETIQNDTYEVDTRIVEPYNQMQEAAKAANIDLTVVSAYRSVEYQQELFNQDVQKYKNEGLDDQQAVEKTKQYMTEPGRSEHHTGLAIDISSPNESQNGLVPEFGTTAEGQWLKDNAASFGFVIRYPEGKETVTKINYEPWHIRYVGKASAEFMMKHGLVLEEYLELLKKAGK